MRSNGPAVLRNRLIHFAGSALTILYLFSCSGPTVAEVEVDLLSYFKSEEKKVEFWLPPFATFNFYLLPGFQLDEHESGPNKTQAGGLLVSLPDSPDIPVHSAILLSFSGEITIRNLDSSNILRLVNLSVHVAPEDTKNIYADGEIFASVPVDDIYPGESALITFGFELTEDSPYAEILDSSKTRIGVHLRFPETNGEYMQAGYELTRLDLVASGRPFSLIPD